MNSKVFKLYIFCVSVPLAAVLCVAVSTSLHSASSSPRHFVEDFYKWYVPHALADNETAAWNLAIKYKRGDFSESLVRLLKEDSTAQAKCNELIGIDFDPFLNSQDPASEYRVGDIRKEGIHYRAEIYSISSGGGSEVKPDVTAEVEKLRGHWLFVNFYYPNGMDLMAILKSSRPKCSDPPESHRR